MADVIIAGSGPAGLTAGIYASRAGLKTIIVSGVLPGGQLTRTGIVENFPGFPEGVDGFTLMERMRDQALKYGAGVEYDEIASAELADGGIQRVTAASGTKFEAPVLIIATGAEPRWPGLPGEEKFRNHGLSVCAACDGHFYRDQDVAVVGGGDSALEEALSLSKIASSVTLIHRRDSFRSSGIMAERVAAAPNIRIMRHTIVVGMEGDGRLEALRLRDTGDGSETVIRVRALFAALGQVPATGVFAPPLETDRAGYIITGSPGGETSMSGVFAAGDCADSRWRQAVTAAAAGCAAAMSAERYLQNRK